jgi:hypothetical protein
VDGPGQGRIINLADARAAKSRAAQLALLSDLSPEAIAKEFVRIERTAGAVERAPYRSSESSRRTHGEGVRDRDASSSSGGVQMDLLPAEPLPHLVMPDHHDVRADDVVARRLHGALAAAAECGPKDFAQVLQVPGVGARTVRSLALVAEVLHGTPCRFTDPARFSLAHGGKDRHPFPVPTKVMDHTIGVLRSAVRNAKLGREEELAALRRLDAQARRLESTATGPSVDEYIAQERRQSHAYGGRSIFGWEPPSRDAAQGSTTQRKARG